MQVQQQVPLEVLKLAVLEVMEVRVLVVVAVVVIEVVAEAVEIMMDVAQTQVAEAVDLLFTTFHTSQQLQLHNLAEILVPDPLL